MFLPQNDDQLHSLNCLTELLFSEFSRIFGKEVMENENCQVFNLAKMPYPILLNRKPSIIFLASAGLSCWSQVIFQLSHEMCHFAILQKKSEPNRYFTVSWFEELVCEAFSLYCLKFSEEHWLECQLSKINPSYSASIDKYLQNELCKKGNDRFSSIETLNDLIAYEKEKAPENDRDSQRNERNLLYYEIIKHPELCFELCNYQKYLLAPELVAIDFDGWIFDTDNDIIKLISTMLHF